MMVYALLDGVTESHTEVDHLTSCESESESDKDEGGSSTSPLCECPTCTLDDSPCQLLDVSKSKHDTPINPSVLLKQDHTKDPVDIRNTLG